MRQVAIIAAPILLASCGSDTASLDEAGGASSASEASSETSAVADRGEAAKRRETMIATWGRQFELSEEQAGCLVDNVPWKDLIAAEQTSQTVAAITGCGTDPAKFEGYGQIK